MRQNFAPFASERSDVSDVASSPPLPTESPRRPDPPHEALPLAAELIARLTAAQTIGALELPTLVESVVSLVRGILKPGAFVPPPLVVPVQPKRRGRPPGAKRTEPAKKRGRPRKTMAYIEPVAAPAEPMIPVVPRLIRRSEAVSPAPSIPAVAIEPPVSGVLRGVVRWFDPARRIGGVRLTGVPGDVAIESEIFAAANITRLFKGQEIEAGVRRGHGRVQITSLRVPGGGAATSSSGPIASMGGRRPRIVIVEKKLDALKRVAARSEAEHVLGSRKSKG